jgi:hypothetical protein
LLQLKDGGSSGGKDDNKKDKASGFSDPGSDLASKARKLALGWLVDERDASCSQLSWNAASIELCGTMYIAMLLRIQAFHPLASPKREITCSSSTIRHATAPRPKSMWGRAPLAFCPKGFFINPPQYPHQMGRAVQPYVERLHKNMKPL